MGFHIDTGTTQAAFDPLNLVPDWFRDNYADINDPKIIHDYGYHLIGQTTDPKTMATVRKHTLASWSFLRCLGEQHPEVLDEFICAYAERALTFE